MAPDCLAVIPARAGSKRIPRKNVREFCGKPMLAHSLQAALGSGVFSEVIVSTDDMLTADVAREHGAKVPFLRPKELSDEHTHIACVLRHALSWYEAMEQFYEFACVVYATAPLLHPRYLQDGHRLLREGDANGAVSVTSFSFPPQRALKRTEDGKLSFVWPEYVYTRSQDLDDACHDAGQFFFVRVRPFLENGDLWALSPLGIDIPRHRVQDIDTEEDWARAELLYRILQHEDGSDRRPG
jgi:N-acylneuraminate cytidylyltransferase